MDVVVCYSAIGYSILNVTESLVKAVKPDVRLALSTKIIEN